MIRRWRARRATRKAIERSSWRFIWAGLLAAAAGVLSDPDYRHYLDKMESAQTSERLLRRRLKGTRS